MTHRLSLPIAVVLGALTMAACSSGGESAATTPPSTTPTSVVSTETTEPVPTTVPPTTVAPATTPPATAPPTTVSQTVLDMEAARTALLVLEDFPEGWTAAPAEPDDDDDDDAFQDEFDACLTGVGGERVADQLEGLEVKSDKFERDAPAQPDVEHEVLLAPDEDTAILAMLEVGTEGASACIEGVLQVFFEQEVLNDPDAPEGITFGAIVVERVDVETSPDLAVGYLVEVPFEIGDEAASQYLHVWYQRDGRALSNLQLSSFAEPFDPLGVDTLTGVINERLALIGG